MNSNIIPPTDPNRWIFSEERLNHTPSIKRGMTAEQELVQRHIACSLIRKIGKQLRDICKRPEFVAVNTAMVFMHRFYMFHSFQRYPAQKMAPCFIFLASKVEETPIKIKTVIRCSHIVINVKTCHDISDEKCDELAKEVIMNENLLLQTLGFDLVIQHPHPLVVRCGDELVNISRAITELAYYLSTNCYHFSLLCLRYRAEFIACICLNVAFKRFSIDLGKSAEGKDWWDYLDPSLTQEAIEQGTQELLGIMTKYKNSFNKWIADKWVSTKTSSSGDLLPPKPKQ